MKTLPLLFSLFLHTLAHAAGTDFQGWSRESSREEIRPTFSSDDKGLFTITHDEREGLDGWFQKSFPVSGGDF